MKQVDWICARWSGSALGLRICLMACCCLGLVAAGVELAAQVSREYDVKAVFLLNFAQFVEWPPEAFPEQDTPIIIGILGEDPFRRSIDRVVHNEKVRNRPVEAKRFKTVEEVDYCHVLFISTSEADHLRHILQKVGRRPVLTVSEIDSFAHRGGMIGLFVSDRKVRLRINREAARAAHLTISSQLLRLAEVVTDRE